MTAEVINWYREVISECLEKSFLVSKQTTRRSLKSKLKLAKLTNTLTYYLFTKVVLSKTHYKYKLFDRY